MSTVCGYKILKCPYCSQLYKSAIFSSFSSFGTKEYSDGYSNASPQPVIPKIVKCVNKSCGNFFNSKEANSVGEIKDEYADGFPLKKEENNEANIVEIEEKKVIPSEWKNAYYFSNYFISKIPCSYNE